MSELARLNVCGRADRSHGCTSSTCYSNTCPPLSRTTMEFRRRRLRSAGVDRRRTAPAPTMSELARLNVSGRADRSHGCTSSTCCSNTCPPLSRTTMEFRRRRLRRQRGAEEAHVRSSTSTRSAPHGEVPM